MRAGARETIYFDPKTTKAAIVTCGGLCGLEQRRPAVDDVGGLGCEEILGIKYGFRGFFADDTVSALERPIKLTSELVNDIHITGGSVVGIEPWRRRTCQAILSRIEEMGIDFLFVIGGNGSHAGALAIDKLCRQGGLTTSVICVPKTIDNDILLLDRTFGFQTAVDEAVKAIRSANIEARSADNGVGLVRLMGRQSGFIAMHAALAPEHGCLSDSRNDCPLEGQGGVLAHIILRIVEKQNHAVVVVAEGAGQEQLGMLGETDAVGIRFCKTLPSICNKS